MNAESCRGSEGKFVWYLTPCLEVRNGMVVRVDQGGRQLVLDTKEYPYFEDCHLTELDALYRQRYRLKQQATNQELALRKTQRELDASEERIKELGGPLV